MDLDLLTDILDDGQPVLSGNLPPHPPHRIQILDGQVDPQSAPFQGTINNSQAGAVVSKIENIFENIASCILDEEKVMSIKLKNRGKLSATGKNATTSNIRSIPNEVTRSIEFPSKSPKEAWKFSKSDK
jgi:meiotic recombination protein SPO11